MKVDSEGQVVTKNMWFYPLFLYALNIKIYKFCPSEATKDTYVFQKTTKVQYKLYYSTVTARK